MTDQEVYLLTTEKALGQFASKTSGLDLEEVRKRFAQHGANQLTGKMKASPVVIFFRQFLNPLVYILVAAASIKAFVKGPLDALVIVGVLLFMAIVGFIQEMRAEKAMDALVQLAAPKSKIRRSGKVAITPAKVIVPGDIIVLEAGDKVPADARLLEASNLKVNESPLTGESLPVEKHTELLEAGVALAERKNMVYMGTSIAYGRATALVTATGMATEIGKIASAIQGIKTEKTALQKSIDKLGHSLIWIILFLCSLLAGLGLWKGLGAVEVFMLVVAAAVAAIPEALPAVVTVVLASGMQRMARHHAIIRKLVAVETLGSTTVICSDKTGTLTLNQMTVQKIFLDGTWLEVAGEGYHPQGEFRMNGKSVAPANVPELSTLLRAGALCNDALLSEENRRYQILGDPTEGALVVSAAKAGMNKEKLEEAYPRLDEIPFQSEKQYMVTLHRDGDKQIAYIKGSIEKILPMASHEASQGAMRPLNEKKRNEFFEAADGMAREAMRVLAVATMEYPVSMGKLQESNFTGRLVFLGLFGMIDPAREEAKKAIELCNRGGIKVIMATGDNKVTAQAIGKSLGLTEGLSFTGQDLTRMSDEELKSKIEKVSVFARIDPLHKLRIVQAFKDHGHVVAMTGDGINDAPALEAADIGISMGITGTDVAKEASDMVLADDNFASIITAVEEGRAIFNRLRNVITFMLATCFGELLTLVLGVLFLGQTPLIPLQILWINLVTGAMISIPLGLEPRTGDELSHPPRSSKVGLIFPGMLLRIAFLASMLGVGAFLVFLWTLQHYELHEARTMAFCSIVAFEWLVAFNARSDERTIFQLGILKNRWVVGAVFAGLALQLTVIYIPLFHDPFDTVPLKIFEWGIVLLPGVSIFLIETSRKLLSPKLFSLGKWNSYQGRKAVL
ncbi:MAG: HAD-IC family P-type ATPase [Candidatus Omnitrophota bacterium]|jgi:Ca2+-transporting ATPase